MTTYEENYSSEEKALAEEIIGLEKAALDKFYQGDSTGYQNLWSHDQFTYFDANTYNRVDTYERIERFLLTYVEGKLKAKSYDMVAPRVQFGQGVAVLTYQLHTILESFNVNSETHYSVIEVYQKNGQGEWKVLHSTWAPIRPFSTDDQEVII